MPNGQPRQHPVARDWEAERARYAWEQTGEAQRDCSKFKDYTNLAKSAPALIMNSGLMSTLAFFQSKENHHKRLVAQICAWLSRRFEDLRRRPRGSDFPQIMHWLANADASTYRLATREVMSLLRWLKQFADARERGE